MQTVVPNPLREGLVEQRVPEPCSMVIFGASGDLTKRKLLPALYSLYRDRLLPHAFSVVGFARRALPAFTAEMRAGCDQFARRRPVDEAVWSSFADGISYIDGAFDDLAAYLRLKEHLAMLDRARGTIGNRVFYLSTPPSYYPLILQKLGEAGMISDGTRPFTRVIIEKPFGRDLESARALNRTAAAVLREDQTYRIDHYLGKETVQNIFVLRFANALFEPLWNSKYIDHVQLTVAEAIGVEGRGGYFEEAGIVRDMVQNHMFQFLTLMAMEPPNAFEANAVRDEKTKILRALRPYRREDVATHVVRGQYTPGSALGQRKIGYRDEKGVAAGSRTETYVAMKLHIDNWRWSGVPFYLRAGKALPKRVTEIAIQFKAPPPLFFGATGRTVVEPNVLSIRIQPDEGISLKFASKVPGQSMEVLPVAMEFRYGSSFGAEPPEAYERLILDCMLGDSTLYTRGDEAEASWRWIDRIFEGWTESNAEVAEYPFGSWGPEAADALLARDGRAWRRP
ncbi:MAG: glucose-6-phosphate dehydrogenase [Myxococcales bacterium]|nr:glucose-6-phosphate dehydrogenase [Myxococcales bacterium]